VVGGGFDQDRDNGKDINCEQVGAEKYRVLRREGKTPLPGPTVLDAGKLFLIPSRERQRDIPCRLMLPEGDSEIRGVYMHIHGGGWVLQSEAE
jgi:acetyl esterase/lipase